MILSNLTVGIIHRYLKKDRKEGLNAIQNFNFLNVELISMMLCK